MSHPAWVASGTPHPSLVGGFSNESKPATNLRRNHTHKPLIISFQAIAPLIIEHLHIMAVTRAFRRLVASRSLLAGLESGLESLQPLNRSLSTLGGSTTSHVSLSPAVSALLPGRRAVHSGVGTRHGSGSCSCARCLGSIKKISNGGDAQRSYAAQAAREEPAREDAEPTTASPSPPGRDASTSAASEVDTSFIHPDPNTNGAATETGSYWLMQPVYDSEYLEKVKPYPRKPSSFMDWTGYLAVQAMRRSFDLITGYGANMTHKKWMTRILFLETVAGVPGMVGAMHRHLRSLRDMRRDGGRIHTLLEESENERMHLLTFLQLKDPSLFFRFNVIATQGVFIALYSLFYAVSERHCHAFVEYLEAEAVKTYTHAIADYDAGRIPEWKGLEAPAIAKKYWRLKEDATFRDVLLNVRADEACHQHVNGAFATMGIWDANPFAPGVTQHLHE